MSLVLIVYLIGVLPSITGMFGFIGGFGSFLLICAGTILSLMGTCYSWDNEKEFHVKKQTCIKWGKRAFKFLPISLFIGLFAALIPTERTMYAMLGAYGVETVASNPDVQRLAKQSLSIIEKTLKDYEEGLNKNAKQ